MSDLDRRLAPTFAAQLALITRRQALAAGATRSAIDRRVRTGRWLRAEVGVYALAGVPWTWRRNLAAVALATRGALASHRSAAMLLGAHWDDRAVAPFELSIPVGSMPERGYERTRERSPGCSIVIHESVDLARVEPWTIDGIPTTPPLRLAVDLGSVVDFERYRRSVAVLRRRHGVDWPALDRVYRQHSKQGRNGCGALRDLLDRHFGAVGVPDEVVEGRCFDLLVDAGLPAPIPQFEVIRPDGRRARFDLAYPEFRIGIETEGSIHGDELVRADDNRRRNNVQLLGWTVFHFSWEEVSFQPDYVVATIRAALDAAMAGV